MIRVAAILIFLTGITHSSFSQEKKPPVIDVRQRLVSAKHDDLHNDVETIDSFRRLHLMIAGNVYQTEKHIRYAYDDATGRYDFSNELKYIQPILNLGDVSMVNLKTSFGNTSANMFSSPDEFAVAVKYSGINGVMHANAHTANIDRPTLQRTRDLLNQYDMFHTGAFADNFQRTGNYPLIINKKGFRIAVLNYTMLHSRPAISKNLVINEIDKSAIERDMRMAHINKPDFIIVYFDWGTADLAIPSFQQTDLAKFTFERGADLVVGTQPNTPLPVHYIHYNYQGASKDGIVAYSLGSLISSNEELKNRNGYVIDMELRKNNYTGETAINDWGVIPVYTYYDTVSVKGKTKVFSVPCSGIESGDLFPNIPYIEKRRAVNSAYEIRKMLGSTADEIQYNLNELVVNNVQEVINITNSSVNNKFVPVREEDVEPGEAPVLPVTVEGSKNTPSLAAIYEEPEKEAPPIASNKKIDNERVKATIAFDTPAPEKKIEIIPQQQAAAINLPKEPAKLELPFIAPESMQVIADTIYRIQFYALKKLIPLDTNYYTHLKGYEVFTEDSFYKYVLGSYATFEECKKYWQSQIQPRYKQSFIVKYIKGRRVR